MTWLVFRECASKTGPRRRRNRRRATLRRQACSLMASCSPRDAPISPPRRRSAGTPRAGARGRFAPARRSRGSFSWIPASIEGGASMAPRGRRRQREGEAGDARAAVRDAPTALSAGQTQGARGREGRPGVFRRKGRIRGWLVDCEHRRGVGHRSTSEPRIDCRAGDRTGSRT